MHLSKPMAMLGHLLYHIWAKNVTFLTRDKSTGDETAMRALSLSHRATRGPQLHHLCFLPLAMMSFCATQCEVGGGWQRGATEGKPSGEIRALFLCVIQYHACVPMNGCQDIGVQSQGTSQGLVRLWRGRGWGEPWRLQTHMLTCSIYTLPSKKNKKRELWGKVTDKQICLGKELRQEPGWLLEIIKWQWECKQNHHVILSLPGARIKSTATDTNWKTSVHPGSWRPWTGLVSTLRSGDKGPTIVTWGSNCF